VRTVAEGRAGVGIVTHAVDLAEELEIFPIGAIRPVVAAPRHHPLGQRRKVALSRLSIVIRMILSPTGRRRDGEARVNRPLVACPCADAPPPEIC
jgi:DNA-binding transcriptional LysR family regulator